MSHKVLIIDDDPAFIELVKISIGAVLDQVEFEAFEDLKSAEEFILSKQPVFDLVIIDQHLPDGKGSDFIQKGYFGTAAILSMSSDFSPEITAKSIGAGATFFLHKNNLSDKLFHPLVQGLIQRNQLAQALEEANKKLTTLETIRKMISTLKHEINNPLAAIFGAIFILKRKDNKDEDQQKAVELIEASSQRINSILDKLEKAKEIKEQRKSNQTLFNIPGDDEWK